MQDLNFTTYQIDTESHPNKIVVLLHGYGSNSKDLISMASDLAPYIKNAIFISPDAPFDYENDMHDAYQWYSLQNRSDSSILKGYSDAKPILHQFLLKRLSEFNLSFKDLILLGFSQGGMMALHYTIESDQDLMAAISCSGYIVDNKNLEKGVKTSCPILMTHGDSDNVVSFETYHNSFNRLKSLELNISTYLAKGLGHGINYACLNQIQKFLESL